MITEDEVEKAWNYLRDTAKEAAVARAQARTMKKYLEVVEAQQKALHSGLTNVAARDLARASPEYKQALDALNEAVRLDCEFKMLREAAQSKINAWQTQSANNRAMERIR